MFTGCFHMSSSKLPAIRHVSAGVAADYSGGTGNFLRSAAFCGLLALGLPETSAAQAVGTMQVSARVIPATTAWTGLSEAALAARAVAQAPRGRSVVRRAGVIATRAEIDPAGDRRHLVVTIHYPHN
jgi:hypothetical protein